jgi:hypothetical protein
MQREPAVDHSGFNRPGVFRGAAASGRELRIDLAYRHTTLNDFDRTRQLEQPPLQPRAWRAGDLLEISFPMRYARIICRRSKRHHRDEEQQRDARVDGEHDHRKMIRFEHDYQRNSKATFGQAHVEGYC